MVLFTEKVNPHLTIWYGKASKVWPNIGFGQSFLDNKLQILALKPIDFVLELGGQAWWWVRTSLLSDSGSGFDPLPLGFGWLSFR